MWTTLKLLGRCERVVHFMGCGVLKGDKNAEREVFNLVGDSSRETELPENERSRSYRVTNRHPNLPWNFMTHGFLHPSVFLEIGKDITDKQKPHKGSWWSVCLGSVPGTTWGRAPGTSRTSQPHLCFNPHRLDRMSPGQTGHSVGQAGHVHGMVALQMWRCPAEFLFVYWLFSLPQ